MALLSTPLRSVDDYVRHFSGQDLPVLRRTRRELEALRASADTVNGKRIAAAVLGDPLMTMRLLTHLEQHRGKSQNHDITTIDRAIMMMGVMPFFDTFADLHTVEDVLQSHPKALIGVLKVIANARRAADYARDWAVVRHDIDPNEITVAALLREATEIVCWVFAPELTLRVYEMQHADRTLRSAVAQQAVFGTTADEIQLGLIRAWRLPELLVHLLDETENGNPRVRTVKLAADFARHLAHGWDDAALPEDIAELEDLLRLPREPLLQRLGIPGEQRGRFLQAPAAD
ncbi:HDOD domain-containing protein [Thauera sinica]|uniref:HDOD domain-containing protein n=1 Tax=Thauera sinica TaxID=2665146 RepID=A0ABW1ALG9_9RHOO|nr:HDOD domain-containing protein [Thauera sp. K11]ATE59111.1 histidine kinase [Thauera sp. K11]